MLLIQFYQKMERVINSILFLSIILNNWVLFFDDLIESYNCGNLNNLFNILSACLKFLKSISIIFVVIVYEK